MAIYKPTDCSPYGGYLNFATIPTGDDRAIYIECKIHTDNKKVTGYRLVLCDAENNIIWDPQYISPVSKLKEIDYGPRKEEDHGDGTNGSTLLIPFVQGARGTEYALSRVINKSPNCLYTDIHRQVDYFVGQLTTAQQTYAYITGLDELSDWNINAAAGDQGFVGAQILFYDLDAYVYKIMILNKDTPALPIVVPLNNIISIKFGVQYHGTVLKLDTGPAPSTYTDWLMYLDNYNSTSHSVDYNVLPLKIDTEYAWKIFLYQGDIQINPTPDGAEDSNLNQINNMPSATSLNARYEKFYYGTYSHTYDVNQYDILIGEGQIMGSNGARLQIQPTDVVLQKKWVQLGVAHVDTNNIVDSWTPWGNRALIDVYSSSTGYIFPTTGSFDEDVLEKTDINACQIYKYSNNTEEVSPKDIVRLATAQNLTPQMISKYVYQLFTGVNAYAIDGTLPVDGDLVLLKDLLGYEYLNGVYHVNSNTSWRRSGMYNNYGSLLNKVFLVNEGDTNAKHNFECISPIGGTIGRITSSEIDALEITASLMILLYKPTSTPYCARILSYVNQTWIGLEGETGWILSNGGFYKHRNHYVFYMNTDDLNTIPTKLSSLLLGYINDSGVLESISTNSISLSEILYVGAILAPLGYTRSFNNLIGSFLTYNSSLGWIPSTLSADTTGSDIIFTTEQAVKLYNGNLNIPYNYDYCNIASFFTQNNNSVIKLNTINTVADDISASSQFLTLVNTNFIDGVPSDGDTILSICHLNSQTPLTSCFVTKTQPAMLQASVTDNAHQINIYYWSENVAYYVPDSGTHTISISTDPFDETHLLYYNAQSGKIEYYVCHDELHDGKYAFIITSNQEYSDISSVSAQIWINEARGFEGFYSCLQLGGVNNQLPYLKQVTPDSEAYALVSYKVFAVYDLTVANKIYQLLGTILFVSNSINSIINGNQNLSIVFNKGDLTLNGSTWFLLNNTTYQNPILNLDITPLTAMLNINNFDVTYLKPNVNLEPDQYIVFNEVDEQPRLINTIDKSEYGATFAAIESISDVYSSVTNVETKEPYKYQIKSYFKESDYNPIYYGGSVDVGFICLDEYSTFVLTYPDNPISFVLSDKTYNVTCLTNIAYTRADDNYSERIKICGYYKQTVGKSWNYYRMILYSGVDQPGVLLQDTGNIYQGDLQEEFFVPASENNYFVLLLVCDEIGNINVAAAKIGARRGDDLDINIDASYNYDGFINLELSNLITNYTYTIFRQEYGTPNFEIVEHFNATNTTQSIHDYNITNNRKYQYIIQNINSIKISPVVTSSGRCWSIVELLPTDLPGALLNSSAVKKKYTVDENNIWLFKYNGDFGSQTQNISKSEQQTLGRHSRIGHGLKNNITGSITALLGQDIIPGTKIIDQNGTASHGYQEQLRNNIISSNNAIDLLKLWRSFVYSKNPKLLKDAKGQKWIVQVMSGQNTPMHHVEGQPDTISFSWTEIENTDNIIITYMPIVQSQIYN